MRISLISWSKLYGVSMSRAVNIATKGILKTAKKECSEISPKCSTWMVDESEKPPPITDSRKKVSELFF